jgi:N-acyl-D-amino-acid deacylase
MRLDLLLRNATVIDGTGAPRREATVGILGDRIAHVGAPGDTGAGDRRATREIDLAGQVLAPGFIDAHTHDDRLLLSDPAMACKISQGVTTVIAGNCGVSLAPSAADGRAPVPPLDLLDASGGWFRFARFADYVQTLENAPAATNAALLIGHTALRARFMADLQRPASEDETAAMRAAVDEALASGAIGVSTGLYYEPAAAATTEEVIEVCRPLTAHRGVYCTHMRDESEGVLDSIDETLRIGRALGVPVVISHHKVAGRANFGRSRQTLPRIDAAMREQPVCLDCYPYAASSTILTHGRTLIARRTLVTWSVPHPEHAGRDLTDIAQAMGLPVEETVQRLLPAGAIYFSMDEDDVQRILAYPHTMIGSDGLPHDARPHPRLWGTFARVLGHYSRDLRLFPLETAIHKMTGLTAANFGLADRGVIREGAFADFVVFDPDTVDEAVTFDDPIAPARGIDQVWVNGACVWRDGAQTGARPGRVLRHPAARSDAP